MLIHASRRSGLADALPGDAHVVLCLDKKSGRAVIRSFIHGESDSHYAARPLDHIATEVVQLLGELQGQLSEVS